MAIWMPRRGLPSLWRWQQVRDLPEVAWRLALLAPEAGALAGAEPVEADVHVVAVGDRVRHAPARGAQPGALPVHRADREDAAVPDDLLHADAAGQRGPAALAVGAEQHRDDSLRLLAVGAVVDVQVPVQGAALGVQAVVAAAAGHAAVEDPHRFAARSEVLHEALQRDGAALRAVRAPARPVVAGAVHVPTLELVKQRVGGGARGRWRGLGVLVGAGDLPEPEQRAKDGQQADQDGQA